MDIEPEIIEDGAEVKQEVKVEVKREGVEHEAMEAEGKEEGGMEEEKYVDEVRIGDETIFTIPFDMQEQ